MRKLLIFLIRTYQLYFSPDRRGPREKIIPGRNCRFTPSCSEYAIEALERFNIFKALYLIFFRLIRCHPFGPWGVDEVPKR